MGVWGSHVNENDDAADWLGDLVADPSWRAIKAALADVIDVGEDYLEVTEGAAGLAAAEVVAQLLGKPSTPPTLDAVGHEKMINGLESLDVSATKELASTAIAVAERVVGDDSELAELWNERDANAWIAAVADLRARLEGLHATPPAFTGKGAGQPDWSDAAKVKLASAAGPSTLKAWARAFKANDARHRQILLTLGSDALARWLPHGLTLPAVNTADQLLESGKGALAAPLYDALAAAPKADATLFMVNGLMSLHSSVRGAKAHPDLLARYLERVPAAGDARPEIYINAAWVLLEHGDLERVHTLLERAVDAGLPDVDQFRTNDDFKPLHGTPRFTAIFERAPLYPRPLRHLQREVHYGRLRQFCGRASIEWMSGRFDDTAVTAWRGSTSPNFRAFGATPDGGLVAFWIRNDGQPLENQPIVLLGSDGVVAVYATDLAGFAALYARNVELEAVERACGEVADPSPIMKLAETRAPDDTIIDVLAEQLPNVRARHAIAEVEAAFAILPELRAVVA